jgi:hypothetical protein
MQEVRLEIVELAERIAPGTCNLGTMNAHENGIPSTEAGEHSVPGLSHTPFAGSEVPGHAHVPEC